MTGCHLTTRPVIRYFLGAFVILAVGGCTEKAADTGASRWPDASSVRESKAVKQLTIPDFVLVDRRDETYRKHGTEDLKDTLAYLGVPVGLEVSGQYVEIASVETLLIYRKTEVFTTASDGQQTFRLSLVACASPDNERQRKAVEIEIVGVPPLKAGKPRIEIAVQIGGLPPTTIRGDVIVWAKETTSGTDLLVRVIE